MPKEKQAAAVKSNILQKQKALSDLFKSLKTLGKERRPVTQSDHMCYALLFVYRVILPQRVAKFESLSRIVFLPANFRMSHSKVIITRELCML